MIQLGYGLRDVHNKLGEITNKSLEGGDAYALMNIFKRRFENEIGFYYDFEIDPDIGSLLKSSLDNPFSLSVFHSTFLASSITLCCYLFWQRLV